MNNDIENLNQFFKKRTEDAISTLIKWGYTITQNQQGNYIVREPIKQQRDRREYWDILDINRSLHQLYIPTIIKTFTDKKSPSETYEVLKNLAIDIVDLNLYVSSKKRMNDLLIDLVVDLVCYNVDDLLGTNMKEKGIAQIRYKLGKLNLNLWGDGKITDPEVFVVLRKDYDDLLAFYQVAMDRLNLLEQWRRFAPNFHDNIEDTIRLEQLNEGLIEYQNLKSIAIYNNK
jgi:hypothetical protein